MKKLFYLFLWLAIFLFPALAYAQFNISAELRPRFEMDNGALKPRPDSVETLYFVSQRTRLKFDFAKEKYQLRLSIQDVRFWGSGNIYSSTGVFSYTDGLDIQEAWFRLYLCEYSSLTIGRQVLKMDDQRLIAGRNWNQFGISYDALNYTFAKNKWTLNAVISYNTNTSINNGRLPKDEEFFSTGNLMKSFNYLHLNRSFNENFQASAVVLGAAYQATNDRSLLYMTGTYGLWFKYSKGIFDLNAEMYYQNGKAQSSKDVSSYMASIHPAVKAGIVKIGIGADYISGDNADNDDYGEKEKTFNLMYGAVFKNYGSMNYYSYMKASTANGGLIDLYPNITFKFNKKHDLLLMFHKFYLANSVMLGQTVVDDKDLGAELDMMYTYKPMPELKVQAGFSYYFTTSTLEKVKGVDGVDLNSPYWGWVMLTFTPKLFSSN